MSQEKRQQIKERITAAFEDEVADEPDIAEVLAKKAAQTRDAFTAFARQHPVATVAGGIALGVLISSFFRNSPARRAGRYAGARATSLATMGGELAAGFAKEILEAGTGASKQASEALQETSKAVNEKAGTVAREIGHAIARALRKD